jgi:hypothetical protein
MSQKKSKKKVEYSVHLLYSLNNVEDYYVIKRNGKMLTNEEVIDKMNQTRLIDEVSYLLAKLKFPGYFMLWSPFTEKTKDKIFIMVIQSTFSFVWQMPDYLKYVEHLEQCSINNSIMTFYSKSGTGTFLLSPCPVGNKNYGHIKKFMKNGPFDQICELFDKIQEHVKRYRVNKEDIYVSTHGLDVPWLHVRLEVLPKHYADNLRVYENMENIQTLLVTKRSSKPKLGDYIDSPKV